MADSVIVAAAQLGPSSPTRAETVERIVALIGQAARADVSVLVFPELALSPYFAADVHPDISEWLEPVMPSEETIPIVRAVRDVGIVTVLPYAEADAGAAYNSSVVFGADGQIVSRYRKLHIPGQVEPDPEREYTSLEKRYFTPGDLGFPLCPTPAGPLGIAICYDRRFPELYRCYALEGARLLACCFNTPVVGEYGDTLESAQETQELAVRAGASANSLPVVAAGKAGVEGGILYTGGSCVIDHKGSIMARAETDGDELVIAALDLVAASATRERLSLETERRPELYSALSEARR
jgi:hypothetical protein